MTQLRFIAVRVGEGDAFVALDGDRTFLVDGGKSSRRFPEWFDMALAEAGLNRDSVDVAICTHNDADHANGVLGMVERDRVRELWLPGSWSARLLDLVHDPEGFARELAEQTLSWAHDRPADVETPELDGLLERSRDLAADSEIPDLENLLEPSREVPPGEEMPSEHFTALMRDLVQGRWGQAVRALRGSGAEAVFLQAVSDLRPDGWHAERA